MSSGDGVKIPIQVTGADEAEDDLKRVGEAVRATGDAKEDAANATTKAAQATADETVADLRAAQAKAQSLRIAERVATAKGKTADASRLAALAEQEEARASKLAALAMGEAGKSTDQFNDSAKTALTGVLGRLNPEMASLANVAVDVAKGADGMTASLAGLAGVGVAIGGVTLVIQQLRQEMERATESARRLKEATEDAARAAMSEEKRLARAVEDAGILGGAGEARKAVSGFMNEGIAQDVATFGAIAQQVSGLDDAQARHVMGAWLATGRKGSFNQRRGNNEALIQKLLGHNPDRAEAALLAKIADEGLSAMLDAPVIEPAVQDKEVTVAMGRLKRTGAYSDHELDIAEELYRAKTNYKSVGYTAAGHLGYWRTAYWGTPRASWKNMSSDKRLALTDEFLKSVPTGDASHTMGELLEAMQGAVGDLPERFMQPVTINMPVTNVDTAYLPAEQSPYDAAREQAME